MPLGPLEFDFDTQEMAEQVIRSMNDLISYYGRVRVLDIQNLLPEQTRPWDDGEVYGWKLNEVQQATVSENAGRFTVTLPAPIDLRI